MNNLNPLLNKNEEIVNIELSQEKIKGYANANPFPKIVIDNFIKDPEILKLIYQEYKEYNNWAVDPCQIYQFNKFFSFPVISKETDTLPKVTKELVNYLNSQVFLRKLEQLTGIASLIPDFSLYGGGMHRMDKGGRLSVHADYNRHPLYPVYRRVNLLIYLNPVWDKSWGGDLQLWDKDMKNMTDSIFPVFNRAVIFNTTPTAYHGHPYELNCPENISRYSIAMYYFTDDFPEGEKSDETHAVWKNIPEETL